MGKLNDAMDYLADNMPLNKWFVVKNITVSFNGNNYASIPSASVPSSDFLLMGVYNGGFQSNPRWVTSIAYQSGTWVIHSDSTVPGTMTVTTLWVHTSFIQ